MLINAKETRKNDVDDTTEKLQLPPISGDHISKTTKEKVRNETDSGKITERRKKKPYKELTLEEKVQLIRLAEENAGLSQACIADKYSIAKSNVCRILQRKQEYLRAYESAGFAGSRKRKLRGDPTPTGATSNTDFPRRYSTQRQSDDFTTIRRNIHCQRGGHNSALLLLLVVF